MSPTSHGVVSLYSPCDAVSLAGKHRELCSMVSVQMVVDSGGWQLEQFLTAGGWEAWFQSNHNSAILIIDVYLEEMKTYIHTKSLCDLISSFSILQHSIDISVIEFYQLVLLKIIINLVPFLECKVLKDITFLYIFYFLTTLPM